MEQKFGNTVNEYYVKRFRQLFRKRQRRLASITTRKQAQEYIREVREKIRGCFALDREERTPLNSRITASHEMPAYTIECILLESRPGFYVTADMYLPKCRKGKVPAVLLLCGHNLDGKCCASYSIFSATLASNGFAVLVADPVCQGERFQFQGKTDSFENVNGHNMLGKKMLACGDFFGAWRAFDAVRSLDYLLQRDEVDTEKIYAVGCSGGGTLTTWLAALDDRLAGAIPSCYITSWLHNVENELPVDAEQTPPGLAGAGLEMADFLIAAAPNYLHISGEHNDIFDARGGHETFEEVRRFYKLLGKEEKISCFFGEIGHGFRPDQREPVYHHLLQWADIHSRFILESEVKEAPAEKKYAAPDGSVFQIPGNCSALEILQQRADKLIGLQQPLTKRELVKTITGLLKIPATLKVPYYRVLRAKESAGHNISRFLIEEPDTPVGVLQLHSESRCCFHIPEGKKCLLYIPHWDSEKELPEFAGNDETYGVRFSFDPFGLGEMTPSSCDFYGRDFGSLYTYEYHFDSCALMLGETYMGMRVRGILETMQLLHSCGYTEITLAGAGQSSVTAALASLLSKGAAYRTILVNPLQSYRKVLSEPTRWPQSGFLPNILKYTDLPQLYDAVHAGITGGWFQENFK